ncbi:MAG: hypothetical protein JXA06_03580 [Bacteroidetes bacterium]|nr:hypothetical protein [Bacteroidota bacterium]
MELLIAFGTDDGINLKEDHVGKSKHFHVYRFLDNNEEFVEQRNNIEYKEDESIKRGDPGKAKSTAFVLKELDGVAGKSFGPNLLRLSKKLVCIVVRKTTIYDAIQLIHANIDKIIQEKEKGENRKHLVFS